MEQQEDLKSMQPRELFAEEQAVRKEIFDLKFKLQSDAAALKAYRARRKKLARILTMQTAKRKAS